MAAAAGRPLHTAEPPRPGPGAPLRLTVLGPVRAWRGGTELDVGPRQQACLLALLLARPGEPVSTEELIALVWDDAPPASAVNVVYKYVGAVRRVLEPGLPPRGSGSYLRRTSNGYVFVPEPGTLDVVSFRALAGEARAELEHGRRDPALDRLLAALALWRGPAGGRLAHGAGATAVFAGLDGEFLDACSAAADLAVAVGRPDRVLPALQLAVTMAPLHEPVHAGLVTALGAAGRQADALAAYRDVRDRLAEDLGVDPGDALRTAHRHVLAEPARTPAPAPERTRTLIGRTAEVAILRRALTPAAGPRLVLLEGEAGAGKTHLLEEIAGEAERAGALVLRGHCLDGGGTPPMWPWVHVLGSALDSLPVEARAEWVGGELGALLGFRGDAPDAPVVADEGARFRLFEQAVAVLAGAAATRRPVLVIDDLHWADVASLRLFTHVATRLRGDVVVLGALRDRAPGPELTRMLAAVSRLPGQRRVRLGGLAPAEVAGIVEAETGHRPGPGVAEALRARTAGNPFFVRELARLLAGGGALTANAVARAAVPSSVRDVVRDRVRDLGEESLGLLQVAALLSGDLDLAVLARAAGLGGPDALERLEPLEALGLLEPVPGRPHAYRFAHDLVRQSVASTLPAGRAARMHLRIADALERPGTEPEAERLAHHLEAAGPAADPARVVAALERAGRRAVAGFAFEDAERRFRAAVRVARAEGSAEPELHALAQLTSVIGMRLGYVAELAELRERAEELARSLGRERDAADFLFSRFVADFHALRIDRSDALARQLLREGEASADPVVQVCGLHAWAMNRWAAGDIGEAFGALERSEEVTRDAGPRREVHLTRQDLAVTRPTMRALVTGAHLGAEAALPLLARGRSQAGRDPFAMTLWEHRTGLVAAMAGDPSTALAAVERVFAQGPDRPFRNVDDDLTMKRAWARALLRDDPEEAAGAAADAAETARRMLEPPRSGAAFYHALAAEAQLAAGLTGEAAELLGRAEDLVGTTGERYAEPLLLLLRARLLATRGEPGAREAAVRARALSAERGAGVFERRAEAFLAGR